jgi:hypothetical protein
LTNPGGASSALVTSPSAIVSRIERRLDQSRRFGRDVDALFKQLNVALSAEWPVDELESLGLAARAFTAASYWGSRMEQPARSVRVAAELSLTTIHSELARVDPSVVTELAEVLLDAWASTSTLPRIVFTRVLIGGVPKEARRQFDLRIQRRSHQIKHQVTDLMESLQGATATASAREYVLLGARLSAADGAHEDALEIIASEPLSDPIVIEAYVDILIDLDRKKEAVDRLRRSLAVLPDKRPVRERLIDLFIDAQDVKSAVEQLLALLKEQSDVLSWEILCDLLVLDDPTQLAGIRASLEEEAPALFVDVLIAQGDADGVAKSSRAKTFSYEQLWRIGHFLAENGNRKAARVYERAISLQGAVAQSKLQCVDFGVRLEAVIPYFESIERPTKPARLAKELLGRQRNNVPLKRELERIFGKKMK